MFQVQVQVSLFDLLLPDPAGSQPAHWILQFWKVVFAKCFTPSDSLVSHVDHHGYSFTLD